MSPIFDLDVRHCRELKVELLFLCVKRSQLRCFGHGCKTLEVFWAQLNWEESQNAEQRTLIRRNVIR